MEAVKTRESSVVSTADANEFNRNGYVVVRGLLTPREVAHYKQILQQLSGLTDADYPKPWRKPGGVDDYPELWSILVHSRLVSIARSVLYPDIGYLQHSDIHVFSNRTVWHRDNACRNYGEGPDWDESKEKYQVLRAGIYLQSYATSHFALGVIPGSHRREPRFYKTEIFIRNRIAHWMGKHRVSPRLISTQVDWIKTEPGDAVLFDARLLHSPSPIRGPKYSIFVTYGPDNIHSRNHMNDYAKKRSGVEYRPMFAGLRELLAQNGLLCEYDVS